MTGGYQGNILDIDLSRKSVSLKPLDFDLAQKFIGGRGLGTKLLWDKMKPNIAPLSPESLLMFLTGPLTGLVPGGAQTCLVFKSPLTEKTLGHPLTGANWGPELKFAGYDGLVLRGKAKDPVYIYIDDKTVEIRDCQHLWGKGTLETEVKLKEELGSPLFRVLCIGPAGENLVRYSTVHQEYFRAAARGGAGCLMGSKKVKAIAVRGTGSIPVEKAEDFRAARSIMLEKLQAMRKGSRFGYSFSRWGTALSFVAMSDTSELDVKNYREAYWDQVDMASRMGFEMHCKVKSRSCFGCPLGCMQVGVIREKPYLGYLANPDFDSSGTIGPGCLVTDLPGLLYLTRLGEDLGLDNESLGVVTSFAMECYEKGILTKADLDGIDLKWGNVPAMIELWQKIAVRQGIGELLSKGVKKASEEIGQGSEKFAMQNKGLEFGGYAPQAHHDRGLQYAIGDRGGCHHYGRTIAEQNYRVWADSLTFCTFLYSAWQTEPEWHIKLLNAATGWNFAQRDWAKVAERMLILARAYNIREGTRPLKDDVLPERVHSEPLTQGPKKGSYYPREKFLRDRAEWYRERGCDQRGVPTKEHLEELELGFVIPALQGLSLQASD